MPRLCPHTPPPSQPTLVRQAPDERAGFTDTWALRPWPQPQGTCPALVRAAKQHSCDDAHQLPDHNPRAVGPTGQAVGWEEERFQVICQLTPVSRGAAGILAAINQLPILQEGKRTGQYHLQEMGRKAPLSPGRQRDLTSSTCPIWGPSTQQCAGKPSFMHPATDPEADPTKRWKRSPDVKHKTSDQNTQNTDSQLLKRLSDTHAPERHTVSVRR